VRVEGKMMTRVTECASAGTALFVKHYFACVVGSGVELANQILQGRQFFDRAGRQPGQTACTAIGRNYEKSFDQLPTRRADVKGVTAKENLFIA
jgi:hypothetical protein